MNDIRTVVVGVDGGAPGWWALAWAADEAAAVDAHLVICRVYPPDHAPPFNGR
jgi:nucleotide-binding universal stress UspA family protein